MTTTHFSLEAFSGTAGIGWARISAFIHHVQDLDIDEGQIGKRVSHVVFVATAFKGCDGLFAVFGEKVGPVMHNAEKQRKSKMSKSNGLMSNDQYLNVKGSKKNKKSLFFFFRVYVPIIILI